MKIQKRNYLNFNFPHFISSIPKLHWRIITICIEFIGFHLKTLASNYRVQSLRFFKPIFIIHVSRNFPIKNVFCHLSLFSIINGYIFSNMSNYADTLYLFSPFPIRSSLCNDYYLFCQYISSILAISLHPQQVTSTIAAILLQVCCGFLSTDKPIFVLDLKRSQSSINKKEIHIF